MRGRLAEATDTVEQVLGRKPVTLDQWAMEHGAAFLLIRLSYDAGRANLRSDTLSKGLSLARDVHLGPGVAPLAMRLPF